MACEICGQKAMNCDCTDMERDLFSELEEARDKIAELERMVDWLAEKCESLYRKHERVWHTKEELIKGAMASAKKKETEK